MARRRNSARSPRYLAAARVFSQPCIIGAPLRLRTCHSQLVGPRLMITTSNILGGVSPSEQYAFAIDQDETVFPPHSNRPTTDVWRSGPTASAATFLMEFDFDQIIGGEIRADGAGAARKRIST